MILIPIIVILGLIVLIHLGISFVIKDYTPEEQEEVWKNLWEGLNNHKL